MMIRKKIIPFFGNSSFKLSFSHLAINSLSARFATLKMLMNSDIFFNRPTKETEPYLYINKIPYALDVIKRVERSIIITRPRRFGKTQFLYTLRFLYENGNLKIL